MIDCLFLSVEGSPQSSHEIALVQASVERQRISQQDRDSGAQGIERKPLYRATGRRDTTLSALAYIVTGGIISLVAATFFVDLPQNPERAHLFGAFSTGFGLVLSYFFGSARKLRRRIWWGREKKESRFRSLFRHAA